MSEKTERIMFRKISVDEAKQRFAEYSFCIVYMMSELQYGKTEEVTVNWDELLELRAFSEKAELRIFQGNGGMEAQCCVETQDIVENVIILEYNMKNGKKLAVKEYLEPDEDGQAVVKYTRPFAMV